MRTTADAVIIGGGAIGTSVLYHLTQQGLRNVVLLERAGLASGSTGASAAIVRQHYSTEVSVRLVQKSLEYFQNWTHLIGGEPIYNQTGWLFLVSEDSANAFDQNMTRLQALGVRTWAMPLNELERRIPGIRMDGVARVGYEPDSGYADPVAMCQGFVNRAREAGAELLFDSPARDIKTTNGRVQAVATDQGEIHTPIVVNAAGPWARRVGQWVGLDLPLELSREQDVVLRPPADMPPLRVTVSDMPDRIYFHTNREGNIICGTGHPKENEPADPDSYQRDADPSFVADAFSRFAYRLPPMERAQVVGGWAGLYTITPDWNMIVDRAPQIEGLYLAVGGSGHSFKLSPAIGLALSELILAGRAHSIDISSLRFSRFAEGEQLRGLYAGNRA